MGSNLTLGNIKLENRSGFPLEIIGEVALAGGIALVIRRADDLEVMPPQPLIGKLSGLQIRGIAALDQLETLMQDRLAPIIKEIAYSDPNRLAIYLQAKLGELGHEDEDVLKAIAAMALFSYRELVDRGMLPATEPDQEPSDDPDELP